MNTHSDGGSGHLLPHAATAASGVAVGCVCRVHLLLVLVLVHARRARGHGAIDSEVWVVDLVHASMQQRANRGGKSGSRGSAEGHSRARFKT